jgi:AcrR family transcriptional regulator
VTTKDRAPRRDATENRAALLTAARVELNRNPESSLETIAASAGLSRRAVYGHFASRVELLHELIVTGAERIASTVAGLDDPDSRVGIARLGASLWNEIDSVRPMARMALSGSYVPIVARALQPLRSALVDTVSAGQRAGELRNDLSALQVARLIEGAALSVLDESTRTPFSSDEGARLVMLAGLGAAGLDWRSAGEVIGKAGLAVSR